jgi:hypothetical protein
MAYGFACVVWPFCLDAGVEVLPLGAVVVVFEPKHPLQQHEAIAPQTTMRIAIWHPCGNMYKQPPWGCFPHTGHCMLLGAT